MTISDNNSADDKSADNNAAVDDAADPESTTFDSFRLDPRLLEAIASLGFEAPTEVQVAAMGPLLEGRDVIGRARTGSGKTAAFGLPLLERVKDGGAARALVLAPTRELAMQVGNALRDFAKRIKGLKIVTIYGGAPYPPQLKALASGATVVVGTPGRVIDHMRRGTLDLSRLEYFVLDEADEMLRMGFIEDVEKVLDATPKDRQVALFSATMPQEIRAVARKHLKEPFELKVEARALTVHHIEQMWMRVPPRFKLDALIRVLSGVTRGTTLVFARTRASCAQTSELLTKRGIDIEPLHGDLTQAARERVLARMRARRTPIVIATDVAARGLDVEHITHVINYDMPDGIETYVHRIGRTGRAGREGTAITFVTPGEMHKLKRLEQGLHVQIAELDVPSDADIARAEQRDLRLALEEAARGDLSAAHAWAKTAAESVGSDVATLGAAALQLLAERENVSLGAIPNEGPPTWAVARSKREPRASTTRFPQRADDSFLFFPVGFKRGVKPADLVGMLANEAQVEVARIGRITVLANKSFVGLPKEVAEHVLKVLPSVTIRGTVVPVRPARDRPEQERGPRPAGTGDRAPSPRASGPGHHKSRAPKKYKPKPKPHLGKRNFKKK